MSCGSLRDLDLVVHSGERVAVVAAAGGGEATLAELLAGVRQPGRGRVRRNGRDVTSPRRERGLRHDGPAPGVVWLSSSVHPFAHLTVYENVLVAAMAARRRSRRVSEAYARRSLERTGLSAEADAWPAALGRSELVRLDVARAIAAPRDLVVVDQPSVHGDGRALAVLADALDDAVQQGAGLVWIDHPDALPGFAERLVVLGHGRVLADASPEEIGRSGVLGGWRPSSSAFATAPASSAWVSGAASAPAAAPGPPAAPWPAGPASAPSPPPPASTPPPASPNPPASEPSAPSTPSTPTTPSATSGRRRRAERRQHSAALELSAWTVPPPPDQQLADFDLTVEPGEIVAVVATRRSGATLLLRSIAGLSEAQGRLWLDGSELTGASAAERARRGLGFVPAEGGVVDELTVVEHFELAGARRRRRRWTSGAVYDLFPSLGLVADRRAGELPVLERRALAMARALAANPTVVMVDQPLQGLTPRLADRLLQALATMATVTPVLLGDVAGGPTLPLADRVVPLAITRPPGVMS